MAKKMLIDATHAEETRVVVVEGNKVEEFDFESENKRQLAGNIYLAKVTRVEPSLQAAFVDYGGNRHGFLAFAEIHPDYYQIPVADREALMEEERAYAEAMRARDEEEEKKKSSKSSRSRSSKSSSSRSSRSSSSSSTKAAKTRSDDPVETKDVASPEDAADKTAEIRGMETIDLGDDEDAVGTTEALVETPADAVTEAADTDATAAETVVAEDAVAAAPAADADEAPAEAAAADETVAEEAPVEETPAEDAAEDTATEEAGDAAATDDAAKDASDEDDAADDAGDDNDDDSDGDDTDRDDAAARDDTIESVADEDDSDDIRPPRKPRPRRYKIQEVIKVRQILLVQVVKEERGNKGAALTTYLSLAGRYCVLMPNTARGGGISRKITNATDRKKLKEIATEIDVPQGAGLIIRTAGAKRTKTEIKRDYEYLQRLWEQIRELTLKSIAPAKIYEEGDLIKRSIRDLYSREIDEVLVEGERGYRVAKDFMKMIMPSHAKNVQRYEEQMPLFARYQVESYLGGMFNPTVQLKSGGYIVIGVTEALVAIDVNSGRATKEGSIEETALKTNLEAADEVARQLRLRDLAGLIVIDFIDMDERKNNSAVEKRMKDRLKTDRARIQVGRISGFGLMEMSRQRLRPGMIEATTQPCPACHGTGLIRSDDNMALTILRQVEEEGVRRRSREVLVKCPVGITNFLMNQKREHIAQIEQRYGLSVRLEADPHLVSPDFSMERFKTATRSVPAVSAPVVSADSSIMDMIDAEDEVEEDLTEVQAEEQTDERSDGGASNRSNGSDGETSEDEDAPKPKKRRRRRRRKSSKSSSSGSDAENGTETDGETASDEDQPKADAVNDAATEGTEAPAEEAAEAPAEVELPIEANAEEAPKPAFDPEPEAMDEPVAAAEPEVAPEVAAITEVEAPAEEVAVDEVVADEVVAEEVAEPVAETPAEEPAIEEPVSEAQEEVAGLADASDTAEEAVDTPADDAPADEAPAAQAAPAPEEAPATADEAPGEEADTTEIDSDEPAKPKRRGWWSMGS
ncbi:Rne/Rng family ribonuclease [Marinibacterium sp. SX1]|uniref:Rne/Rng family ribonuclease n=1 Tax=Marinibacterium sp. SX1 TaxID=3388424 RepID=UPI003D184A21